MAIAVAATNLQPLIRWAKRTGNTDDPLTTMNVDGYGFVELDEHGRPDSGAAHPPEPLSASAPERPATKPASPQHRHPT